MPRQMANANFLKEQQDNCFAPHIKEINLMVDELRKTAWAPYVAPLYGGNKARVLCVLSDPGPMTVQGKGSGFICIENDDDTAERLYRLLEKVNINAKDIISWNAYPWRIDRPNPSPNAAELKLGVEPMKHIIELLPNLEVVMLLGGSAQNGWKKLNRCYPSLVTQRKLRVISTYHTGNRVFAVSKDVREYREQHLQTSFQDAARHLGI